MPGDLESAPVLMNSEHDECLYRFEWHTAAACVLSKTKGDNCRVSDPQAGKYLAYLNTSRSVLTTVCAKSLNCVFHLLFLSQSGF